jgi:adenosylcobyric acid synthase
MERKAKLWPVVCEALNSLIADFDRVVIEGAGSPAEINLREGDIVNMSVALECQADVYLIADIDRGGAFAHLLGTWHCLSDNERKLLKGFVLNKFRGDQKLLGNAMDWLEERTGVPTVAIIPMIRHELPEEDTFHYRAQRREDQVSIALVVYPYASNLDEFDPLINEKHVNVVPVRDLAQLNSYDAILLPGSKNSSASLRYLRETGLAAEISHAAQRGILIVGICGGMQILGQQILDPHHLESGDCTGLGLLDLTTTLVEEKVTRQREMMWNGKVLSGYEIHHGKTQASKTLQTYLPDGLDGVTKMCWEFICMVYLRMAPIGANFLSRWAGWGRKSPIGQRRLRSAWIACRSLSRIPGGRSRYYVLMQPKVKVYGRNDDSQNARQDDLQRNDRPRSL